MNRVSFLLAGLLSSLLLGCQTQKADFAAKNLSVLEARQFINDNGDFLAEVATKRQTASHDELKKDDDLNRRLTDLSVDSTFVDNQGNVYFVIDFNLWSSVGIIRKQSVENSLGDDLDKRIIYLERIRPQWLLFTLDDD